MTKTRNQIANEIHPLMRQLLDVVQADLGDNHRVTIQAAILLLATESYEMQRVAVRTVSRLLAGDAQAESNVEGVLQELLEAQLTVIRQPRSRRSGQSGDGPSQGVGGKRK